MIRTALFLLLLTMGAAWADRVVIFADTEQEALAHCAEAQKTVGHHLNYCWGLMECKPCPREPIRAGCKTEEACA